MARDICIDRCICYDRTFAELKSAAAVESLQLDEISKRFG